MTIYTLILILGGNLAVHPVNFHEKASCEAVGKEWATHHKPHTGYICLRAKVELLP